MARRRQLILVAGAALVTGTAHAQASVDHSVATPQTLEGEGDGDIIVTAQKRSERLVDVPIAITAISGDDLSRNGFTDLTQIGQATPGLNVASGGLTTQPTIRGVGSSGSALGESANVATYVDGVYIANQTGMQFEFADIDRIEVLKGPQGTLFGRNATGGAIQLITRQPSADFGGYLSAGYGRFNEREAKAYVTGGTEKLAVSVTGLYRENDGYAYDVNLNRKTSYLKRYAARAKLRFVPTDALEFTLSGDYEYNSENDFFAGSVDNALAYALIPDLPKGKGPRQVANSFYPVDVVKQGGVNLKTVFDIGSATITSITAQRWIKDVLATDGDGTPADFLRIDQVNPAHTFTQELNYASKNSGSFNWIGGLFYFRNVSKLDPLLINGAVYNRSRLKADAYAAFGEATFNLTDTLTLIGGLRYSIEKQHIDTSDGISRQIEAVTFKSLTPRVSVRLKPTDRSTLYATFSQGFKSGTFNPTSVGAAPVKPEKIDAYELGYKWSVSPVSFSIAGYYYKYRDLQVQVLANSATSLVSLENAAKATIYGADADLTWKLSSQLTITAGAAYNHAVYDSYDAVAYVPAPGGAGNVAMAIDASGRWLPRSPRYTLSLSPKYSAPLAGGELELSANFYFSGKYFWDANNRPKQPAYEMINAQVSWTPDRSALRFTVFGNNLTNRNVTMVVFPLALADITSYQKPRTYGGRIQYSF